MLGAIDATSNRFRLVALVVETEVPQDSLHQRKLILVVVDREIFGNTEALPVAAKEPSAGRVEGSNMDGGAPIPEKPKKPVPHLASRLVGERHGEDSPGSDVAGRDEMRHSIGDHPRLAASRACEHDERATLVNDSLPLTRIQRPEVEHRGTQAAAPYGNQAKAYVCAHEKAKAGPPDVLRVNGWEVGRDTD